LSVQPESTKAVYSIAKKMPHIADDDVSQIVDEWNAYRVDAEAVIMSADAVGKRVDHYWREILLLRACDGSYKYANMAKLIKAVLLLPHGNADVERGFSINNDVLTDDRTEMSAKTRNGLLLTKDAIKYYDPVNQRPTSVPLTRSLLTACRSAYAAHEARLE